MRWREHGLWIAVGLMATLACGPALAQVSRIGGLEISGGWIAATEKPGNAIGYFVIDNHGDEDWLIGASCAGAYGTTMNQAHPHHVLMMGLHPMSTDLRPVMIKVPVPANGQLAFQPGGNFLMLQDVRWALRPGRQVDCTLIFELAGPVAMHMITVATTQPPPP